MLIKDKNWLVHLCIHKIQQCIKFRCIPQKVKKACKRNAINVLKNCVEIFCVDALDGQSFTAVFPTHTNTYYNQVIQVKKSNAYQNYNFTIEMYIPLIKHAQIITIIY